MSLYSADVVVDNEVLVDGSAHTQPISGSVSVSNFPATQPVSGTVAVSSVGGSVAVTGPLTDTQLRASPISVLTATGSSATVAQVVMVSNTNNTILAANANRKSAIIYVPTQPMNIKFGATASATSFTYRVTANASTVVITGYTGQIDGFGQNNTLNVTEVI